MLIVLDEGGRLAARRGTRDENGVATLEGAAYTPCAVTTSTGCPKEPTWKISAVRVTYRPDRPRVYYQGARLDLFGIGKIGRASCRERVCRSGWIWVVAGS